MPSWELTDNLFECEDRIEDMTGLPRHAVLKQHLWHVLLAAILGSVLAQGRPLEFEEPEKPKISFAVASPEETGARQFPGEQPNPSTFKGFSKDLGKNFLELFSRDNLLPLLIGAGATGGVLAFDDSVDNWFNQRYNRQAPTEYSRLASVEDVGNALGASLAVASGIGSLTIANQFIDNPKLRSFTYTSAQGFVLNSLIALGIKTGVRRERPDHSNKRSFPSGHTSNMFTMATITNHYYGPKVGIPAFLFAGFVGVSRIDEGVHHLSDVVAGATLGYIVGHTVIRRSRKNPRFWYFPMISTKDQAVGVTLAARF